jgi:D-citramalate synthase
MISCLRENQCQRILTIPVSKLVETLRDIEPANKPIVGDNVFTQTAGIHADGDNKKQFVF